MADLVFNRDPAAEAYDYLARKAVGGRFSFDWRDVEKEEHAYTFVVAKAMSADLLTDIHGALTSAMTEGKTKEDFAAELRPVLQAKGWWGKKRMVDPKTGEERLVTLGTPRRLGVIYDTNMRMANAAGVWERFTRSAATRPYLRYNHVPQEHARPMHEAWDGITLPIGHVFWLTHYCPNGWGCKCFVTSVRRNATVTSEEELQRRGVYDTQPWLNKRTGVTQLVPKGIDPGFDYNVGLARARALAPPPMPEPQRAYVQGDRMPATLPELPAPRRLPPGVKVRDDLAGEPQAVFEAFSKVIGKGEGEIFTDAAQTPLVISRRMFETHDASGASVGRKLGLESRARMVEILAATLADPDEIWHSLQTRADGRSVLVRTLIATFDVPTLGRSLFSLIFHEGASRGVWMGATAFAPGKAGKPADQLKQASIGMRIGTLVFRRK
jgi:hypothetical protein